MVVSTDKKGKCHCYWMLHKLHGYKVNIVKHSIYTQYNKSTNKLLNKNRKFASKWQVASVFYIGDAIIQWSMLQASRLTGWFLLLFTITRRLLTCSYRPVSIQVVLNRALYYLASIAYTARKRWMALTHSRANLTVLPKDLPSDHCNDVVLHLDSKDLSCVCWEGKTILTLVGIQDKQQELGQQWFTEIITSLGIPDVFDNPQAQDTLLVF